MFHWVLNIPLNSNFMNFHLGFSSLYEAYLTLDGFPSHAFMSVCVFKLRNLGLKKENHLQIQKNTYLKLYAKYYK